MTAWCAPGRRPMAAAVLLLAGEPAGGIEETPHLPRPDLIYLVPDPAPFLPPGPVEITAPPPPRLPGIAVNDPRASYLLGGTT